MITKTTARWCLYQEIKSNSFIYGGICQASMRLVVRANSLVCILVSRDIRKFEFNLAFKELTLYLTSNNLYNCPIYINKRYKTIIFVFTLSPFLNLEI